MDFDSAVVISPFFWNFEPDMWQTTHHVAQELALRCPTVFVEPAPQWGPGSEQFRLGRCARAVWGPRCRMPRPGLTVFHRRGIPFGRSRFVRELDLRRNAAALRALLSRQAGKRRLVWVSHPYWTRPLLDAIDREALVYHSLDHSDWQPEQDLIREADVVFSVSQPLVERHRALNPRSCLLPNGVDPAWFDAATASQIARPAELPSGGRLIGFVGSVNYHLDLVLLERITATFPDCALVVLGPVLSNETAPRGPQRAALERLRVRANVRLIGFRPPWQLAPYVQAFDVCLIPLLPDPFNAGRDPMKFYQYSALGKPIVSTPVPVAERYADLCYMAGDHDHFLEQVRRALAEGPATDLARRRIAMAKAHGWGKLLEDALSLLHGVPARGAP
jgi:glycosyltransferase involved in cell wall biosynthesis